MHYVSFRDLLAQLRYSRYFQPRWLFLVFEGFVAVAQLKHVAIEQHYEPVVAATTRFVR